MQANLMGLHQVQDILGWLAVGEQGVELGNIALAHHRVALKLGVIGNQIDLTGVANDRLGNACFLIVELQQRTILIDTADPDDAEVHLELVDKVDGCLTDDATVARAHLATGNDDVKVLFTLQNGGYIEVVGNDLKPLVLQQGFRYHFVTGTNIDEQRGVIGDVPGDKGGDTPFGLEIKALARAISSVDGT